MKLSLGRNISPRTAATLIALAALAGGASMVASRESQQPAEPVEAVAPRVDASRTADTADRSAAIDLDLSRLQRPAHEGQVAELFAARAPAGTAQGGDQPGAPAAPAGPPALPFQYLGKLLRDGKLMVFLSKDAKLYTVQAGQLLENQYKVEGVTEEAVTFTYMPMGARQTLNIPARS